MPGARAIGRLVKRAMEKVIKAEAITVEVNTASFDIPEAERIAGFTTRIYIMDAKVVRPARNSVLTLVFEPWRLNITSIYQEKILISWHIRFKA
jgi:hypothetical protein